MQWSLTRMNKSLAENGKSSNGLNVKTVFRKKIILIFHVPVSMVQDKIKHKICRQLGTDIEQNEDKMQLLKSVWAPAVYVLVDTNTKIAKK